jgi:hypothetical protein
MAYRSESATSVWKGAIHRGLAKDRQRYKRLVSALIPLPVGPADGRNLTDASAILFPKPLFDSFVQRLVRGLHWHCFGEILTKAVTIKPYWVNGPEFKDPEVREWIDSGPLQCHAGGQFKFKVFDGRPNDLQSFWIFELHGHVFGAARCSHALRL